MNWNELWKIKLNNYSDEFILHEITKLLVVKSILQKYSKSKKYQEIYTEYPIGEGKVCDVYWNNLKTKETVFFEIQKNLSSAWLESTKKAYSELDGDLVIIPIKELSDSIKELNEQIKGYIP